MKDKNKEQLPKDLEIARRQLAKCKASEAKKREQIDALIGNEERFNLFIENFPDPVISYTLDGSIQYVNNKTEEVTGYSREELVGKNITDPFFVAEESITRIKAYLKKQNHTKPTEPHELEGISKSGFRIIFEVVEVPVSIKGKPEVFIIARDITKKKSADKKADHLESVLQSIRSANISSSSKKNRELILEKACEQLTQMRKYQNAWIVLFDENNNLVTSSKAGIGHEFKSIVNQFRAGKPLKCVKASLKRESVIVTENPLIDCCECPLSMLYYSIGCISVRFKYDNSYGVIVASLPANLVNDKEEHKLLLEVTKYLTSTLHSIEIEEERKLIEGTIRKSEEKHRQILESLTEGIWQVNAEGRTIYTNPSMVRMLGYSENELSCKHFVDFLSENDRQKATHFLEQHKRGKPAQYTINFIKKDGTALHTSADISHITNEDGKSVVSIISIQDITEQKRIEEDLKESERRYRLLADNAYDVIMLMDMNLKPIYFSPSVSHVLGYSVEEALAGSMEGRMPPTSIDKAVRQFQAGLNEEKRHPGSSSGKRFELEMIHKDGSIVTIEMMVSFIRDQGRKPTGILGILRDVTERKRAEQLLAESEDRHRALVEAASKAGIGIVTLQSTGDQEAVIVFANDGAIQMTGYSKEEILSKPLSEFIPLEEFLIVLERYRNRQRGNSVVPFYETHIISKNGAMLPVLISAATLKYQSKIATVVYFRDMTQIKEAEKATALHTKNMEAILAVARAVSQIPATNKMLMHALDKVNEVIPVDKSCIYLLNREKKCLKMKTCSGISDKNIRHYADLPLTETQLQNLQQWKDPFIPFEDIFGKATVNKMQIALKKNKAHSYTVVPLMIKDNVIGILYIVSDKGHVFTKDDTELLTALSYEIAIGIDNAELLERTIEMSLTDELTGLYNRRHFYNSLEMEMYRTKRYGPSFALALLDLNGFKEYNDRYGHASGDSILQMFAKALQACFRKTDIICRYGGDEFSIILPSTDDKTAKDIVERFRSKWSTICEKKALIDKSPMGFSCGISKFPDNSESADGLVFLADAAMYCAKTGKENSSIMASEMSTVSSDILRAATKDHIYALAATVDAKDPSTCGHSKRVADIAEKIGKAIGLPQKELSKIYSAALLHDIGKIGVPDSILTKPSHPTPEEWAILKKHPSEGAKIIGYVEELNDLVPVILHHHEWYNGKGYPDGLQGKDIPIGARITSVADAYDTMTTERTYRNLISSKQACEELVKCSGTQFDPTVVKIWCKTIQEAD